MGELRWVESSKGALALDDRTFPVLFATWIGHADEAMVRAFYAWNDQQMRRVVAESTRFALITDATSAERPSSPVRALLEEMTQTLQRTHPVAMAPGRSVGIVVLDNPIVRGALTAVGWLVGGMSNEYAATCVDAIERSERFFREQGATWPAGLTPASYRRARRDQARSSG